MTIKGMKGIKGQNKRGQNQNMSAFEEDDIPDPSLKVRLRCRVQIFFLKAKIVQYTYLLAFSTTSTNIMSFSMYSPSNTSLSIIITLYRSYIPNRTLLMKNH